jgi:hypothetical protein
MQGDRVPQELLAMLVPICTLLSDQLSGDIGTVNLEALVAGDKFSIESPISSKHIIHRSEMFV